MESRYIKIGHDEAVSAKVQLLSSEINVLNLVKKIRNYKILRKKEMAERNKIKLNITNLRGKLDLILSSFPEHEKLSLKLKPVQLKEEPRQSKDIQDQLDEIKQKLSRLQ